MEENQKKLGYLNHIGLGVGSAIGTGIFIMLGYGIAYTGRSIVLVCGIGCIFMLLAFWYSLAFGSLFVLKGGDYSIRAMVFPPVLTGVSAWFQITSAFVLAGHSLAITQFAEMAWPQIKEYERVFALLVLTFGFLCTIKGSKILTTIQNLVVVALVAALIMFLFYGLPEVDAAAFFSNADGKFAVAGFGGFIAAVSALSFACMGTAANVSMAPVTNNPKRTIPLSSMIVTVIVGVVYSLMAYVASGVLPYEEIAGANISVTAEVIMSHGAFMFFVVGGGIFAITSTMLGVVAILRYPIQTVAEDGWIPKVFLKTTKGGYPWVLYAVLYAVSCIPLLTGLDIEGVIGNVMVPTMLMNTFINFYCIKLPKRYPEQWEKRGVRFPVWLWNLFSVSGGSFAIVVIYNTFINMDSKAMTICVIEVAVAVVLSIVTLKKRWVTEEDLENKKQAAIQEVISADAE